VDGWLIILIQDKNLTGQKINIFFRED